MQGTFSERPELRSTVHIFRSSNQKRFINLSNVQNKEILIYVRICNNYVSALLKTLESEKIETYKNSVRNRSEIACHSMEEEGNLPQI